MTEVIGIRIKNKGKIYDVCPGKQAYEVGDQVIVEMDQRQESATVVIKNHTIEDTPVISPVKRVIRRATKQDLQIIQANQQKEKTAFAICLEKIGKHGLEMKLIKVEYTFDNSKILFYFTADGRIDFRQLVKDLAGVFRTRIELRQIGVRDEAKLLGGLGICGFPFCCGSFLDEFQPVSIKMAKEQGLSLSPTKISGTCGRLMCCLQYEQSAYDELLKVTPSIGALVKTPEGKGRVVDRNLMTQSLYVALKDDREAGAKKFRCDEVTVLRDCKPGQSGADGRKCCRHNNDK